MEWKRAIRSSPGVDYEESQRLPCDVVRDCRCMWAHHSLHTISTTILRHNASQQKTSVKKKVKVTLVQALRLCTGRTAHRGSRGIALPFLEHGTRRGWGVSLTPRPLFTPGKTRYPLYRRLGGPQGRSGQVRKISPKPEIDPRTFQPVVSHYTDYATRPMKSSVKVRNLAWKFTSK